MARFLAGCDLAGCGLIDRDLPILTSDFSRSCVTFRLAGRALIDVVTLQRRLATQEVGEPRRRGPDDLESAALAYLGRDLSVDRGLDGEVTAVIDVINAMVGRRDELARTPEELHESAFGGPGGWLAIRGGVAVLARGRHSGRGLAEVAWRDPVYLRWLLGRRIVGVEKLLVLEAMRG